MRLPAALRGERLLCCGSGGLGGHERVVGCRGRGYSIGCALQLRMRIDVGHRAHFLKAFHHRRPGKIVYAHVGKRLALGFQAQSTPRRSGRCVAMNARAGLRHIEDALGLLLVK